tara:strand:+ start:3052 stop:3915 length:864 start_codon:yes stop_codon:yes gene_type:complete
MKKYLTVLAGNPRGGEQTWESLYKYVINHLDSDLALCTGDKWVTENSLFNKSDFTWIFQEPDNWFDYYEENFTNNWYNFFSLGKETGLYNSGNIHFAIKDIILKNYIDTLEDYDFVIYSRFDQFYTDYHIDIPENSNNIWIPSGENYHGVGDRHAIVPGKEVRNFLNICEYVDSPESIKDPPEYLNCETAYKRFLHHTNLIERVKRYERKQFTSSLKTDKTNWRVGIYSLYFYKNLMIKYPDEFIDSIANSIKTSGISYYFREAILVLNYFYLITRRKFGKFKKLNL